MAGLPPCSVCHSALSGPLSRWNCPSSLSCIHTGLSSQDLQVPSVSQLPQVTRVSLILVTHVPKIWGKCKPQFPPHCHPLLECGMGKLIPLSGGPRSQNVFTLWVSVYCLYFKTVNLGLPSEITWPLGQTFFCKTVSQILAWMSESPKNSC